MFRAGNDDAFRVIYDRYRHRLFAYTRQMLSGSRQDAEDALQDVFVRAYGGLRASNRDLALRAWLYRVAHNRCIDELRRPVLAAPEVLELVRPPANDPIAEAEHRESLRRLVQDVRRLPEQQRSALMMRELAGMTYREVADALDVSAAAVKSLLVRARVGLAQAAEARDTACGEIRDGLILAHDRGVRPTGMARRHMRDCAGCREFRGRLRGTGRQFAALLPAVGPAAALAKLLGIGGGAGGGAAAGGAGGGAAAAGVGSGGVASAGLLAAGSGHVASLLAAAVVTAGGAVEIQHTLARSQPHRSHHRAVVATFAAPAKARAPLASGSGAVAKPVRAAAAPPAGGPDSRRARTSATPAAPVQRQDATGTGGQPVSDPDATPLAGAGDGANMIGAQLASLAGGMELAGSMTGSWGVSSSGGSDAAAAGSSGTGSTANAGGDGTASSSDTTTASTSGSDGTATAGGSGAATPGTSTATGTSDGTTGAG
jgi:RNA polymerase sigma factor (sigma-70 family)